MRTTLVLASLLTLACGSALASNPAAPHIGPSHAVDTTVAINPQPLPPHDPRPGEEATLVAGGPPTVVDRLLGLRG